MDYNQIKELCMTEKIQSPNKDRFSDRLCTRVLKEAAGLELIWQQKLQEREALLNLSTVTICSTSALGLPFHFLQHRH